MGNGCQIHDLLHGVGCQHGKTGLTGGHDIGVITENIQCMGGKAAGADMHYAGQQLSCNLVHIGNHEQQTLGCGVGGGQGACGQGTVESTCRAGLGLQLGDLDGLSEQVLAAVGCPLIDLLRHG